MAESNGFIPFGRRRRPSNCRRRCRHRCRCPDCNSSSSSSTRSSDSSCVSHRRRRRSGGARCPSHRRRSSDCVPAATTATNVTSAAATKMVRRPCLDNTCRNTWSTTVLFAMLIASMAVPMKTADVRAAYSEAEYLINDLDRPGKRTSFYI